MMDTTGTKNNIIPLAFIFIFFEWSLQHFFSPFFFFIFWVSYKAGNNALDSQDSPFWITSTIPICSKFKAGNNAYIRSRVPCNMNKLKAGNNAHNMY